MMLKYKIQDVEKHEAYDQKAEQVKLAADNVREDVYPKLSGALGARLGMVTKLARELLDELLEVTRRKEAYEWAAEHVLDNENEDEDYETFYATAEVIEDAMKNGMTDDELRKRLRAGIEDGKFKQEDDRPNDIENRYCAGGMNDVRFG